MPLLFFLNWREQTTPDTQGWQWLCSTCYREGHHLHLEQIFTSMSSFCSLQQSEIQWTAEQSRSPCMKCSGMEMLGWLRRGGLRDWDRSAATTPPDQVWTWKGWKGGRIVLTVTNISLWFTRLKSSHSQTKRSCGGSKNSQPSCPSRQRESIHSSIHPRLSLESLTNALSSKSIQSNHWHCPLEGRKRSAALEDQCSSVRPVQIHVCVGSIGWGFHPWLTACLTRNPTACWVCDYLWFAIWGR